MKRERSRRPALATRANGKRSDPVDRPTGRENSLTAIRPLPAAGQAADRHQGRLAHSPSLRPASRRRPAATPPAVAPAPGRARTPTSSPTSSATSPAAPADHRRPSQTARGVIVAAACRLVAPRRPTTNPTASTRTRRSRREYAIRHAPLRQYARLRANAKVRGCVNDRASASASDRDDGDADASARAYGDGSACAIDHASARRPPHADAAPPAPPRRSTAAHRRRGR